MRSLFKDQFTKRGIGYGLLGTLFMSIVMLIGMGTGLSPIPEPIPAAIAKGILGDAPRPLIMGFALITHFGYGAFWGAVLFNWMKTKGNIWHGQIGRASCRERVEIGGVGVGWQKTAGARGG